jgi:Uma2 family endonuclease
MSTYKWTSRDLETLPDNGKLYEVIEGELYVSKQPHLNHQIVGTNIVGLLKAWSAQNHLGVAIFTPGIIFADDNDVVPDAVWISHQRLASALEYWIINWLTRQIEVFRREETILKQVNIVYEHDALQSPFLPGFHCQAREVFADIV